MGAASRVWLHHALEDLKKQVVKEISGQFAELQSAREQRVRAELTDAMKDEVATLVKALENDQSSRIDALAKDLAAVRDQAAQSGLPSSMPCHCCQRSP